LRAPLCAAPFPRRTRMPFRTSHSASCVRRGPAAQMRVACFSSRATSATETSCAAR
jgi:hypothetical protein